MHNQQSIEQFKLDVQLLNQFRDVSRMKIYAQNIKALKQFDLDAVLAATERIENMEDSFKEELLSFEDEYCNDIVASGEIKSDTFSVDSYGNDTYNDYHIGQCQLMYHDGTMTNLSDFTAYETAQVIYFMLLDEGYAPRMYTQLFDNYLN